MHGLVNRALQEFLKDTYGPAAWARVRDRAGLPFAEFEPMLHYPDPWTAKVVDAACAVLHREAPALLEDLGTWLVSHPAQDPVRRLLRYGGVTFVDFLQSLEELPGRATMALPDLHLPDLALRMEDPGRFLLEARWRVPGIGPVLLGALRAMADDYGVLALVEMEAPENGAERVRIELLEAAFATGRHFDLGAST